MEEQASRATYHTHTISLCFFNKCLQMVTKLNDLKSTLLTQKQIKLPLNVIDIQNLFLQCAFEMHKNI